MVCEACFEGAKTKNGVSPVRWYWVWLGIALLAFALHGTVQAQSVKETEAAYLKKDYAKALPMFKKLANQNDARAQFFLGEMYANGRGVVKDDTQAVYWYHKAAEQGGATAQYNLGLTYANGSGVVKDDVQALYWYRKAAIQGDDSAQNNLGGMYEFGIGVPKDEQTAYFWYLLASVKGEQKYIDNRDSIEKHLTPEQRANAQAQARNWQPKPEK